MTNTDCKPCQHLAALGIQCNDHRVSAPSAATLRQREVMALANREGMKPSEAEARLGLRPGRNI